MGVFFNAAEKHLTFFQSHLREGTLGDLKTEMLARPRWSRRALWTFQCSFATETKLGCLTPDWDFLKRLLVPPHQQKNFYHYFSCNLWWGELRGPRQCLNWGCISAPLLWNLLCTLIPPTSSPNTCLWVMSRLRGRPKPAFRLSSLSLSLRLPLSQDGGFPPSTHSLCQFNV